MTNKVHQLNDIVSGQPLVIKMIVSYYRTKGLLTELLGTLALTLLISFNFLTTSDHFDDLHINIEIKPFMPFQNANFVFFLGTLVKSVIEDKNLHINLVN